jgi:four helix bundle protein
LDIFQKSLFALKEARETNYWLRIIRDKKMIHMADFDKLLQESEEIKKILGASIKTARSKSK